MNQLTREVNPAGGYIYDWEHDGCGNISKRKEYDYATGTSGTPNTVTYTYGNTGWGDLLTAYDGRSISYVGGNLFKRYGLGW